VTGDPVRVPPAQVAAVALVLNELLTNCAKHAFPGRATGAVTIQVAHTKDQIELQVHDDGIGLGSSAQRTGLGTTIVRTIVGQSLRGTVAFATEAGTRVTLRFPSVKALEGGIV
jgi:two-component sensor histidine kinase